MEKEDYNYYSLEKRHLLLRSFKDVTDSICILLVKGLKVPTSSGRVELRSSQTGQEGIKCFWELECEQCRRYG